MVKNSVLEVIDKRRSVRKYKDTPLSKEQIQLLLEAALISPSSKNMEPWHLTVLTKRDLILEWEKVIIQHFIDINDEQVVANNAARDNKIFYDAPVVFVISMEEGKAMDVGIMAQSIALAAKSMGLDSVILGFPRVSFEEKYAGKWHEALKFPAGYVYGVSVAVGYGDNYQTRDRQPDMSKVTYID